MVQQAPGKPRPLRDVESRNLLAGLDETEKVEGPVERARLAARRNHRRGMGADARGTDPVPFVAEPRQLLVPAERGHQRRARGRARDDRAVHADVRHGRHRAAEQPVQPALQLGLHGAGGRRGFLRHDRRHQPPVRAPLRDVFHRHVAEPQVVAGLGAAGHARAQREEDGPRDARRHSPATRASDTPSCGRQR